MENVRENNQDEQPEIENFIPSYTDSYQTQKLIDQYKYLEEQLYIEDKNKQLYTVSEITQSTVMDNTNTTRWLSQEDGEYYY